VIKTMLGVGALAALVVLAAGRGRILRRVNTRVVRVVH
jgi:hypothetical protein